MNHDASTSTGATTRAVWIAEPTQIVNTMSILSWRANTAAANRSDTVPTNASMTAPRNTGDNPSCDEVASSASETSSDWIAITAVTAVITTNARETLHSARPLAASPANMSRWVTRV